MENTPSPDALLAMARKQLGISSKAKVPAEYMDELKKHVVLYEHDTNFKVTLQPGTGFGFVTCLEQGCNNAKIDLVARVSARDGGRRVGLGSLSAYRVHIAEHATHSKERHQRVKAELGIKKEVAFPSLLISSPRTPTPSMPSSSSNASRDRRPSVRLSAGRKSSILQALDSSPITSPTKPSTPTNTTSSLARQALARSAGMSSAGGTSPAAVKPEPQDFSLPKKRTSDAALTPANTTPRGRVASYKKPKLDNEDEDVKPHYPALLPPPPPRTVPAAAYALVAKQEDTSEIRDKLKHVQSQLARVRELRANMNRKLGKTKADITRIGKYDKEIRSLEQLKEEYNDALPSIKPLSRSNSFQGPPVASGSNVQLQGVDHLHIPPRHRVPRLPSPPPIASSSAVKVEATAKTFLQEQIAAGLKLAGAESDDDGVYDHQGNWHGRGYDHFRGPVAKADDIEEFLLSAGNAENFDGNDKVDTALEKLGLDSIVRPLPGMEVALMPHQVIGVAWMLNREQRADRGGILADEMGLGKTVQMLSLIVKNRPEDPLRKTTLIITPVALLDQWAFEIDMKTNLDYKVLIYHGSNKPKKIEELRKYDIILTTFHTLAFEYPDPEAEEKEKKKRKKRRTSKKDSWIVDDSDEDVNHKKKKKKKSAGLLLQMEFHRVVIDEAQAIRNKTTRVSRAVTELKAKYRWCLTGTPIINGLSDAYGLIRFLRIRPWHDWQDFNSHIALREKKQPALAATRLQAIFAIILLRRKKDSLLDGKPLVTLPLKTVNLRKLKFSKEERDVYQMVEARSQNIFNRFLRAGTVLKNYHQVLVLLLRLRQICSHPSLIQEDGVAFVGPDEQMDGPHDKHSELTRAAQAVSADFVDRMKAKFKEIALERLAAEKESADAAAEGEECPICYDAYTDPVVTACTHVFCRECITNVLNGAPHQDANDPDAYKDDERPCPTCRGPVCPAKLFSRFAFEPTDAELAAAKGGVLIKDEDEDVVMIDDMADVKGKGRARPPPGRSLRTRKARPTRRVVESDDEDEDEEDGYDSMSDFIVDSDEEEMDEDERDARREARRLSRSKANGKAKASLKRVILSDDEDEEEKQVVFGARRPSIPIPQEKVALLPRFLPSTKMKYMMESLRSWAESHPDEKTLIISQWTQCLSLVSDYLLEHGFIHVKYQGDMTRNQRDTAVRYFMSKDKATIMLMSLKCGGVGLNLTRANRVISLDLGWSEAIESQAFDRVHRLGQHREVTVERLVISNTVEDRVLALQERKKNLADGSLGEGNGKKVGRLTVKELANLFGLDHRGNLL